MSKRVSVYFQLGEPNQKWVSTAIMGTPLSPLSAEKNLRRQLSRRGTPLRGRICIKISTSGRTESLDVFWVYVKPDDLDTASSLLLLGVDREQPGVEHAHKLLGDSPTGASFLEAHRNQTLRGCHVLER